MKYTAQIQRILLLVNICVGWSGSKYLRKLWSSKLRRSTYVLVPVPINKNPFRFTGFVDRITIEKFKPPVNVNGQRAS